MLIFSQGQVVWELNGLAGDFISFESLSLCENSILSFTFRTLPAFTPNGKEDFIPGLIFYADDGQNYGNYIHVKLLNENLLHVESRLNMGKYSYHFMHSIEGDYRRNSETFFANWKMIVISFEKMNQPTFWDLASKFGYSAVEDLKYVMQVQIIDILKNERKPSNLLILQLMSFQNSSENSSSFTMDEAIRINLSQVIMGKISLPTLQKPQFLAIPSVTFETAPPMQVYNFTLKTCNAWPTTLSKHGVLAPKVMDIRPESKAKTSKFPIQYNRDQCLLKNPCSNGSLCIPMSFRTDCCTSFLLIICLMLFIQPLILQSFSHRILFLLMLRILNGLHSLSQHEYVTFLGSNIALPLSICRSNGQGRYSFRNSTEVQIKRRKSGNYSRLLRIY